MARRLATSLAAWHPNFSEYFTATDERCPQLVAAQLEGEPPRFSLRLLVPEPRGGENVSVVFAQRVESIGIKSGAAALLGSEAVAPWADETDDWMVGGTEVRLQLAEGVVGSAIDGHEGLWTTLKLTGSAPTAAGTPPAGVVGVVQPPVKGCKTKYAQKRLQEAYTARQRASAGQAAVTQDARAEEQEGGEAERRAKAADDAARQRAEAAKAASDEAAREEEEDLLRLEAEEAQAAAASGASWVPRPLSETDIRYAGASSPGTGAVRSGVTAAARQHAPSAMDAPPSPPPPPSPVLRAASHASNNLSWLLLAAALLLALFGWAFGGGGATRQQRQQRHTKLPTADDDDDPDPEAGGGGRRRSARAKKKRQNETPAQRRGRASGGSCKAAASASASHACGGGKSSRAPLPPADDDDGSDKESSEASSDGSSDEDEPAAGPPQRARRAPLPPA